MAATGQGPKEAAQDLVDMGVAAAKDIVGALDDADLNPLKNPLDMILDFLGIDMNTLILGGAGVVAVLVALK
jgi:hypothetical protein